MTKCFCTYFAAQESFTMDNCAFGLGHLVVFVLQVLSFQQMFDYIESACCE